MVEMKGDQDTVRISKRVAFYKIHAIWKRKGDYAMFKKTLTMLLLSCSLMGVLLGHAFAAETITEKYEFPAQPGTQEWLDLETTPARRESCEIPEDILTNMTTEALVETAGEYPFLVDMYAYNTVQEGFEALLEESDLFVELLNRVDAGEVLLEKYQQIEIVQDSKDTTFATFAVPRLYEIYLSQPEIQKQFSDTDLSVLDETFYEKYKLRAAATEVYGNDVSAAYQIQAQTRNNLRASKTTTIRTPNGTKVSVLIRDEEYTTTAKKQQVNNSAISTYPNAEFVSDSTTTYNCHSYAWLQDNDDYDYRDYWMNDPSDFWDDGSFVERSGSERVGDIGIYTNASGKSLSHSAIVYSTSGSKTMYISKWADGPVMIHSEIDCPYAASHSIRRHFH